MSIVRAIFDSKAISFEEAFGAADCASADMKQAIAGWYRLYYEDQPQPGYDPSQRIAYTVVNKLCKTVFGEYQAKSSQPQAQAVLDALMAVRKQAMQQALIGGECFLKPLPSGTGFQFFAMGRDRCMIFGRDSDGVPTDVGLAEKSKSGRDFYTLLERRTLGPDGRLTIRNMLYRSDSADTVGTRVSLQTLPQYERMADSYTFPQPVGSIGLAYIKTPMANCVDGSSDGVSVYAAAAGLIRLINQNESQLNGEFERGESRIIVSSDLLKRDRDGRRGLRDHVFVGIDDDPESAGITIFSPALREQSFLARKKEYLRNVETVIGIKRGLLSEVEAEERTATEVTSSAGDYNLTIIDFQQMWEKAVRDSLSLCRVIGAAYNIPGAAAIDPDSVSIDWGNGILYDEEKTWAEYMAMVSAGMLKPEIALAWRFNLPAETPEDLRRIREAYLPDLDGMMGGDG